MQNECYCNELSTLKLENKKLVVVGTIGVIIGFVGWCTLNKCNVTSNVILTNANKSSEPSNISLDQILQLVMRKLSPFKINVKSITYLGHGCDFDSFCIDINDKLYVLRTIRINDTGLIHKLKVERKILPMLKPYFAENGVDINIPEYNSDQNSICLLLSNMSNPHKSYIYSTYSMIDGKQLCLFGRNEINKCLAHNSDKLANILSVLHQCNLMNKDKADLFETAGSEFECLVEELEECYLEIDIGDKQLIEFIKTEMIEKCNNILIPKWNEYETIHMNKQSNKFVYELIHGDLHGEHILLSMDNNTIVGIIDWSDIMVTDIAMEFRYLWAIHTERTLDIVSKYKSFRKFDKDRNELFDVCVNIYGYITLVLNLYWSKAGWGTWTDSECQHLDVKYYINVCKKYQQKWIEWTRKVITILS
eukprot:427734_1